MSCQLTEIEKNYKPQNALVDFCQNRIKLIWWLNGYRKYLQNAAGQILALGKREKSEPLLPVELKSGDVVSVRSRSEIESTLDRHGRLNGCTFAPEMFNFCDNTYRVFKRVDYFFDEVKLKMCRCKNTVLLTGVHCSGERRAFSAPCDRHCFYFWNTAWLEKKEVDSD